MFTNALIHEKSPYLRQHAHNPVNWLPWGEPAFSKAREQDKPIFLSVGYSTCHWCHVMAHESFEDEGIAELLNRDYVCIKLDREERPDVDRIYMLFVQASTGSGGWPMSVFLSPQIMSFYGGTYFPPGSNYGRPGFRELLTYLAQAWKNERQKIESSSNAVTDQLRSVSASAKADLLPDIDLFNSAYGQLRRMFDPEHGGFGRAPKFPRPVVLNYLLRYFQVENNSDALDMVTKTLRAMAAGGMHDQLGGGFHRYSVDEFWFVPHFEKMLYDQSQLVISYLEAFQITGDNALANTAQQIFSYVLRDLTSSDGAFYSAEDADSPDPENSSHSGEGAFYIWRQAEIESLLGKNSAFFCKHFGVQPEGNVENDPHHEFAGRNILFEAEREADEPPALPETIQVLFNARAKRPRPHLDAKVLTSWNGLMISAFVKGFTVLGDQTHLDAAERCADFLLGRVYDGKSGQLLRRYCEGAAAVPAFLDDYAFLAQALLDLFEATGKPRYLGRALDLAGHLVDRFEDHEEGGFFSTEQHASDLLIRMKDDYDGAEPSGNSVATDVLLRLTHLTGEGKWRDRATLSLRAFAPKLKAQPTMAPHMLVALGRWLSEPEHFIVRSGNLPDVEVKTILAGRRRSFLPYAVTLEVTDEAAAELAVIAPFLATLQRRGKATVYACQNFACELPRVLS